MLLVISEKKTKKRNQNWTRGSVSKMPRKGYDEKRLISFSFLSKNPKNLNFQFTP